jgi:hypothetical protein
MLIGSAGVRPAFFSSDKRIGALFYQARIQTADLSGN